MNDVHSTDALTAMYEALETATNNTPLRIQELINEQRSQLQISKETGIDQTVISRLKNPDDVRDLNADITRRLALTYGVTADWLLGLPNAPKYPNTVNLDTLSYADICETLFHEKSVSFFHRRDSSEKDNGKGFDQTDRQQQKSIS